MNPVALVGSRSTLARLLFPSWAFFDAPTSPPLLEIRQHIGIVAGGTWQSAFTAPTRRWWHLLFNPMGNQVLWYQTQIERFCASVANGVPGDIADDGGDAAEQHDDAMIVREIAERCIPPLWPRHGSPSWQYRIVVAWHSADSGSPIVVFESDVLA